MKILYMSHRYHTNQNTIMKGWKEHGDTVCFLSQYAGKIEDYTYVKPIVVGYSFLFNLFYKIYVKIIAKKNPNAMDIRLKIGAPPIIKLARIIRKFNPDIVIMRERSIYTICMTAICRFFKYPVILYVMNPVWDIPKKDFAHKLVWKLVPKYRMTPSLVLGTSYEGKEKDKNAYFAPYLMEPQVSPNEKQYFDNNKINILEVGKYEERKNHKMMVLAAEKLSKKYNIHLTIVGEKSNDFHRKYYTEIEKYIINHKLTDIITLKSNLKKNDMMNEYKKADLFVLPSTGEPASVTNLEGMAFSIPVICGEDNGTACYIEDGKTGYVFRDNDDDDLIEKIELIISDRVKLREMGKRAYEHVEKNFQFDSYYKCIEEIMIRQKTDC